ncbi:MAG: rod shape-determining protein MreD, partial [Desemzia incerta]
GIYTSLLPAMIYLSDKLKKILNPNLLVLIMITILQLSLTEFLLYGFYMVIDLATIDVTTFLANRLGPTLLLNTLLLVVLYYPLKKLADAITRD